MRTCISRNDKSLKSMTGLSADAEHEYIHSGVGESYVKALPVKAGEWYYLLVDNVYSNGGGHTVKLRCSMKKRGDLYVGMKLNYGPINFTSESDTLMTSSFEPLDSLIKFMDKHPQVKVEIQGHVNAPLDDPSVRPWRGPQWLSDARARRVYMYMVSKGVPRERLKHEGYSNRHMIFPYARTQHEYRANMRVDFIIMDL